ncbi:MAG TPA: hypothetical protein VNJ01_03875 [Bacteriovoracaceae bacterium]|nr:hypothetical protein [Bacteriovoracaceae bacterium]
MKSKNTEATQRVLVLLKLDANNLFDRIKGRKSEYLEIFALRRTREHFPMIFCNRYQGTSIMDLSHCSPELITTLDQFYRPVEEMSWYLFQTEDMPNTVEDYIDRKIARMEKLLRTLNLFLDAELGVEGEAAKEPEKNTFIDQPVPEIFEDDFSQES